MHHHGLLLLYNKDVRRDSFYLLIDLSLLSGGAIYWWKWSPHYVVPILQIICAEQNSMRYLNVSNIHVKLLSVITLNIGFHLLRYSVLFLE